MAKETSDTTDPKDGDLTIYVSGNIAGERGRVDLLCKIAHHIARSSGMTTAEMVRMLMVAAIHLLIRYIKKGVPLAETAFDALEDSIATERELFPPKRPTNDTSTPPVVH